MLATEIINEKKFAGLKFNKYIILYISIFLVFTLTIIIYTSKNINLTGKPIYFDNKETIDFRLKSISNLNQYLDSKKLIGKRYILSFFKIECQKCDSNNVYFSDLQNLGIDIYGITTLENSLTAEKKTKEINNVYKDIVIDSRGTMSKKLMHVGAPETFLIDENGKISQHIKEQINDEVFKSKILPFFNLK